MLHRDRLIRRITMASLLVAVSLALLKLVAAVVTGSVALLSLLIDSLADVGASGVTFLAVRVAQQPPDHSHRFGHGKAEALSALAQSALVAGSAFFVLVQAGQRFIDPQPLAADVLGMAVTAISLLVTSALVLAQRAVVRRTGSTAVRADRLHYTSDLFTNAAVLLSLVLVNRFGVTWLDPLVGAAIAIVLVRGVLGIGWTAVAELMDRELPEPDRRRIQMLVEGHPEVEGIHDLRSRRAAGTRFIEFHIELDGDMPLREAHRVTEALEAELAQAIPDAEIIIHQEPVGLEEIRLDDRIEPARPRDG